MKLKLIAFLILVMFTAFTICACVPYDYTIDDEIGDDNTGDDNTGDDNTGGDNTGNKPGENNGNDKPGITLPFLPAK